MRSFNPYQHRSLLITLLLSFLLFWFYMLGARTLVPTDEGRYAEMAREMLMTGDWLTPRLNGIKYFEKPPLQNWMNAATFALFGLGEWQARLWTGISALIGLALSAYAAGVLFGRRVGITTFAVLASSLYWSAMGHINSLDMGLAGMMTVTLCSLLLAQRENASITANRNWMLVCWISMALAVLSKGLIGVVLPGAILIVYSMLARDFLIWKRLHLIKGLILFFAVASPWFVLVALKNPEHPQFFFIHEHWDRFTSNVHKRSGPWHYYFPLLVLGVLPWIYNLFDVIKIGIGSIKSRSRFKPELMLFVWVAFLFLFFSYSGSKLPGYIILIFPAISILVALSFEQNAGVKLKRTAITLILFALGMLAASFWAAQSDLVTANTFEASLNRGFLPWLIGAASLLLLGGAAAWYLARKEQTEMSVLALSIVGFIAVQLVMLGHEPWGKFIAGTHHLRALNAELKKADTPIYAVGLYEQALPFYLQKTTTLVGFSDEMGFGVGLEPEKWIADRKVFVDKWKHFHANRESAIAILRPAVFEQFLQEGLPMRVIGSDSKRVIIALPVQP